MRNGQGGSAGDTIRCGARSSSLRDSTTEGLMSMNDNPPTATTDAARPATMPGRGPLTAVPLAFAMTTSVIALLVVVPLLGKIGLSLHASPTATAWSLISVTLISGVTTPVFGRLGDMFGYRKMLIAAFTLLAIGTVICALAPNTAVFLTGRVLQGFVGGTLPLAIGVVRNNVQAERVRTSIGMIVAGEGVGVGIGYILGGLLQNYSWQITFWVILAPTALSLLFVILTVPRASEAQKRTRRFDLLGALLLVAGTFMLLLPLSEGSTWGWSSGRTLALFAGGAVVLFLWGAWESRASDPLVDLRQCANAPFVLTNAVGFCFGIGVGAFFLLFVGYAATPPQLAGYGFGASVLHAGSFLLPNAVVTLIAGPIVGAIAQRIGARPVLAMGTVLGAAMFFGLAGAHNQQWELYSGSGVWGLAVACLLTGMYSLIAETAAASGAGVTQGINSLVYAVGVATGSAATTAVLAARTIPRTPISVPAGYQHAYIMCGLATVAALIVALTEARLARRRVAGSVRPASAQPIVGTA
jgi:MFS family permease